MFSQHYGGLISRKSCTVAKRNANKFKGLFWRILLVYRSKSPITSRQVESGQVVKTWPNVGSSQLGLDPQSGQVRSSQVRSGQVRSSQVKSGQVRSSQVKITVTFDVLDPLTSRQVESGQVVQTWPNVGSSQWGLDPQSGQVRSSQVKSGQVRSSQVKSGQVRSSQVKLTMTFDVLTR
jgi:hypothetical protein